MFTLRTGISREKSKHRNYVDSVDSVVEENSKNIVDE